MTSSIGNELEFQMPRAVLATPLPESENLSHNE